MIHVDKETLDVWVQTWVEGLPKGEQVSEFKYKHPYVVYLPYMDRLLSENDLLYLQESGGRVNVIYKQVVQVPREVKKIIRDLRPDIEFPLMRYLSVSSFDYEIDKKEAPHVICYKIGECTVKLVDNSDVDFVETYDGNLLNS